MQTVTIFQILDEEKLCSASEKEGKPIMSTVVRPLVNLPVGPLGKSIPYGG
jgi:hypothetical protein